MTDPVTIILLAIPKTLTYAPFSACFGVLLGVLSFVMMYSMIRSRRDAASVGFRVGLWSAAAAYLMFFGRTVVEETAS